MTDTNLQKQYEDMTRALAGKVVETMDGVGYGYVVSQIQAIRDRGEDPTEYEAVMVPDDETDVLKTGWKILIRKQAAITDTPAFLRKRISQIINAGEDEDRTELADEIFNEIAPYLQGGRND